MVNGSATEPDDAALVERAKAGELEAFDKLVQRYEDKVYSLAMGILQNEHDAEDVTQQTFMSVIENLQNFRGDSSFSTWIMKIATHAALKVIRKRKGLPTVSFDAPITQNSDNEELPRPEFIADWRDNPSELASRNETRRLIEQALSELDESYRIVFLLRDVEGLSVKETANILNISEANVKIRLLRARLQLREKLTRLFGDEKRRILSAHQH